MKYEYEAPTLKISLLEGIDIICSSPSDGDPSEWGDDNGDDL